MSHLHKLSKETRDRHFPESNGGKGSKPRTSTSETRKKYEDNWDKIFGKKKWAKYNTIYAHKDKFSKTSLIVAHETPLSWVR